MRELAEERDAVILAHNYQLPEVQDVAHYVGDSLGLSRRAAEAGADTIVFCGVHFMAETAAILCPQSTVLIPDLDAGCSLAASIDAEQLAAWREKSGRRRRDVRQHDGRGQGADRLLLHILERRRRRASHLPSHGDDTEILFGPDMWLGAFVERQPASGCTSGTASATSTPASGPATSTRCAPNTPTPRC